MEGGEEGERGGRWWMAGDGDGMAMAGDGDAEETGDGDGDSDSKGGMDRDSNTDTDTTAITPPLPSMPVGISPFPPFSPFSFPSLLSSPLLLTPAPSCHAVPCRIPSRTAIASPPPSHRTAPSTDGRSSAAPMPTHPSQHPPRPSPSPNPRPRPSPSHRWRTAWRA